MVHTPSPPHPSPAPEAGPDAELLPSTLLAVFTTVGDADTARRIAHSLVTEQLAACVQIEAITSVYRWGGQVQTEGEHRMMIKATRAAWPALHDRLVALHPYELPAIHALPVVQAHPPYARWVQDAVQPAGPPGPRGG